MLITVNHNPKKISREAAWLSADRHRNELCERLSVHDRFAWCTICIEVHCSARKHRKAVRGESALNPPRNSFQHRVLSREPRDVFVEPSEHPQEEDQPDPAHGELETIENPDANLLSNFRNTDLYGYPHFHIAAYYFAEECQLPSWRRVGELLMQHPSFTDIDVKRVNTRRALSVEKAFSYVLKDYSHPATMELLRHYSAARPYSIMVYYNQLDSKMLFENFFEGLQDWIPLCIRDSSPMRGRFTESMKVPYSDRAIDQFFFKLNIYMLKRRLAYYDGNVYELVTGSDYTYKIFCDIKKFIMDKFAYYSDHKTLVLQHAEHFLNLMHISPVNSILPSVRIDWDWIEFSDCLYRLSLHEEYQKHPDLNTSQIRLLGQPGNFFPLSIPRDTELSRPKLPKTWLSVLESALEPPPDVTLREHMSKFCACYSRHLFQKRHRERCMFLLGPKRSGKTMLIRPLLHFFPLQYIGCPQTGLSSFLTALVRDMKIVVCDDIGASAVTLQDYLKLLGAEMMTFNDKNKSGRGQSFYVDCHCILANNKEWERIFPGAFPESIAALNDRVMYWKTHIPDIPISQMSDEEMMSRIISETPSVIYYCNWWRVQYYQDTQDRYYLP